MLGAEIAEVNVRTADRFEYRGDRWQSKAVRRSGSRTRLFCTEGMLWIGAPYLLVFFRGIDVDLRRVPPGPYTLFVDGYSANINDSFEYNWLFVAGQ